MLFFISASIDLAVALVLPHTARLMDYIAAWWVACQLRPAQLAGSRHTFI